MKVAQDEDKLLLLLLKRREDTQAICNLYKELAFMPAFPQFITDTRCFAHKEAKKARRKAKKYLSKYCISLQKLYSFEKEKRAKLEGCIFYTQEYITRLEIQFIFPHCKKKEKPLNLGTKEYLFADILKNVKWLIYYAAKIISKRSNKLIAKEDLEQEGLLLLWVIYQKKKDVLGIISLETYFKVSLWRHLTLIVNKQTKRKEAEDTYRQLRGKAS